MIYGFLPSLCDSAESLDRKHNHEHSLSRKPFSADNSPDRKQVTVIDAKYYVQAWDERY